MKSILFYLSLALLVSVYAFFFLKKEANQKYVKSSISNLNLLLVTPQSNENLKIRRPSESIRFHWKIINEKKSFVQENLSYNVLVVSPNGEILVRENTKSLNLDQRNFLEEGEYEWSITPVINGKFGKEVKAKFNVRHPDLAFSGKIEAPSKVSGTIQENGEINFNSEFAPHVHWQNQSTDIEERILVEISQGESFNSIVIRKFTKNNFFDLSRFQAGRFFVRASRVSPFGLIKGVSNILPVEISLEYPLKSVVKNKLKKEMPRMKKQNRFGQNTERNLKKNVDDGEKNKRNPSSVTSEFQWKWSYLIPKEIILSAGQGEIDFNQKSSSTDANASFSIQNIGLDLKFQEQSDFFVDSQFLSRTSSVQGMNDYSDSYFSLALGREWIAMNSRLKGFAAIGAKYSSLNFFEQNSATTFESKQENVFSASAQLGLDFHFTESVSNKLKLEIDVGDLTQYGIEYNGRYAFQNGKWFVEFSGGYFDGSYSVSDRFNKKTIDRAETRFFMGIGRSFK